MSIRPRDWRNKDGSLSSRWIYDYVDNSGTRRHRTFKKKRDAEAARQKIEAELAGGTHTASRASVTVAQASELWYTGCEARNPPMERTTLETYQRAKDKIDAELGAVKLNQLSTGKVIAFRDKIAIEEKERGNTGGGAARLLLTLGAILADAQERGLVAQNVVYLLRKKKGGNRLKPKLEVGVDIPTPDEIRRLIAQLDDPHFVRWRPMLLTFIFTGLRASEVRGLPKNNVDLVRQELHVRQRADAYKKIGAPKTKGSRRTVPLLPTLVSVLREHMLSVPKTAHNLVFPTRNGDVYDDSTITNDLKLLQVAAGIVGTNGKAKYSLHKLRHFYASLCINRKIDGGLEWPIKTVSERLGHASIRMTADTYGHLFPRGDDRAELAAADAMFFTNLPAPRPATGTVTMLKPVDTIAPAADIAPAPQPVLEPISETAAVDNDRVPGIGSASPRARATAAILAYPNLNDRSLAKKIGVSPQTVHRAREMLNNKNQPGEVPVADEPMPMPTPAPVVSGTGRSTRGQFLPGPRYTAEMARVEAAVLANPDMSARALAKKLGVGKTTVLRARRRRNPDAPVSVEGRSTRGQFLPGPRYTAEMARVEAAVLANPDMGCVVLARKIGASKATVLHARKRLNLPAPRPIKTARVEAAVLANPDMSTRDLAEKLGVSEPTVLSARRRLKNNGENPVSEVPVEAEAPEPDEQ